MNKVILIGKLTDNPELRHTKNEKKCTQVTLAVDRGFTNQDGKREADFIRLVFWEKIAETLCKHVKKGHKIAVVGKIQVVPFDKEDGTRSYRTDVICKELYFLEKRQDNAPEPEYKEYETKTEEKENDPFADFGASIEIDDEDLPF